MQSYVRTETPDLDQVHELNRLFLTFLQAQARSARFCFGLPADAVELLRVASVEVLDRAARLPRALFRFDLSEPSACDRLPTAESHEARALQSLQLTILLTVWNISRRSPYRARAFFGLTARAVQRLRALSLSQLPGIAVTAELVACDFDDAEWLWRQLLTARDPTDHERLMLVALQPAVRRVPHK